MNEPNLIYDVLSRTSLILLMLVLGFMLLLYKSIYDGYYKLIWFALCAILSGFIFMVYNTFKQISADDFSDIKVNFIVMMLMTSSFLLIFIYISNKIASALKKSNITKQYLDKIMESMSSYMIVTDSGFNIQRINQAVTKEVGLTKKQLLGSKLRSIVQGCNFDILIQTYSYQEEAFIKSRRNKSQSVLISGEPIYDPSGTIDGYVFIGFKNYQKEINKTYSYFRSIFDNSEFAIVTTDLNNDITGANKAAEGYFGLTEREMLQSVSLERLHHTQSIEQFKQTHDISSDANGLGAFKEHIQNGKIVNEEMLMHKNNGKAFPALVTFNAIQCDGEIIGYFELIADITNKKQVEEKLQKANKDLKDFAHIVSHDLKAPLRAISSLASWLNEDYSGVIDQEGQDQLKLMINRTSRMENLINGILDYSRVGNLQQENELEDLNNIVSEVGDSVVPAEKFSLTVENQLPHLNVNRTRILQIFQNIISNSVKYMDKDHGKIHIRSTQENGFWKFSVEDNGPGIEDRYFEKIFQIFQTLKPRDEYESTGVGLAIVKKSVELYGGKVWLESKKDVGTIFHFTLPEN